MNITELLKQMESSDYYSTKYEINFEFRICGDYSGEITDCYGNLIISWDSKDGLLGQIKSIRNKIEGEIIKLEL